MCQNVFCGWGSALDPARGANSAPSADPVAGFWAIARKRKGLGRVRKRKGEGRGECKKEGREKERENEEDIRKRNTKRRVYL